MRRIAFCFHLAERGGSTLWLANFLKSRPFPKEQMVAFFPADSPLVEEVRPHVGTVRIVAIEQTALLNAGALRALALAGNRAKAVARFRAALREEKIGLVYVNSSVQVAPLIAARLGGIPAVVHVHEATKMGRGFAVKRAIMRKLASGLIFAARSGMELFTTPDDRMPKLFSPNGTDPALAELRARRAGFRTALGLRDNERAILFLGRVSKLKGVADLVRSFEEVSPRFPSARLLIAGIHPEEERDPAILRMVEGKVARATYLGFRADAAELLAASDLFVLPSYAEAFPLSVSEAMMVGTPVVARGGVGDLDWIAGDDERIKLFTGDGLASVLAGFLTDESSFALAAIRAQKFALAELKSERQRDNLVRFLNEIQ